MFNLYAHFWREYTDKQIKKGLKIFTQWILLSLYFYEYEYLMNLFSYKEIKKLFEVKSSVDYQKSTLLLIEKLTEKMNL